MDKKLLKISKVAEILDISVDTLRRWDKSGKLKSLRLSPSGHRYYKKEDVDLLFENLFAEAKKWVLKKESKEPREAFYCSDSYIFQLRLAKLEEDLQKIQEFKNEGSLITAVVGEIGNNSFDHNLGAWRGIRGIFFAYDLNKREIVLADRGQGVLKTLKRVKSELENDAQAIKTAFTEKITGRAPEKRGNGLKFVRMVVTEMISFGEIELFFQSGTASIMLKNKEVDLKIKKEKENIKGCFIFIKF